MKKILIPVYGLILCILLSGFIYSADRPTKKYDYKDFHKVEVSNGMLLNIIQSSSYSVEVSADESDFEYLQVVKKGNTLKVYIDRNNYRKKGDIQINIKMPVLTGLDLSGGSRGEVSMNIKDNFNCELSGGAEVSGNLNCKDINIEVSGGSTVNFSGRGNNLTADASGGSIYHLKDFAVKNVDVDLSGGSRLEINMNGTLDVDASGGSRVIYYGSANIGSTDFSGGSGISQGD
jgi:hypothetical protein